MATITLSNQSNKTIPGTQDDDTISLQGSGQNDTVNGLNGDDVIRAANVDQNGNFISYSNYTNVVVNGGTGSDDIYGFGNGSTLNGDGGDDDIYVGDVVSSDVKAYGDAGADSLYSEGNSTNALLDGGAGYDFLEDSTGDVGTKMYGGTEGDDLYAYGNNDRAYGEDGSDTLVAEAGTGTHMNGGDGRDYLYNATGEGEGGSTTGSTGIVLNGNAGKDYLNDEGNQTTLLGGADNDQLVASNGASTMTGGTGADVFFAEQAPVTAGNEAEPLVSITDFVHGEDRVSLSSTGASSSNYREAKIAGGQTEALTYAEANTATGAYTFVAGDTDGYLVYNEGGGNYDAVKIDGANQLADFGRGDIKGANASQTSALKAA